MSRKIEAGSKTLSSKTRKLLILLSVLESVTARKEFMYLSINRAVKLTAEIMQTFFCYQLHAEVTSYSSAKVNSTRSRD
jgi:hypothetical protein